MMLRFLQILLLLLFIASCTDQPNSDLAGISGPEKINNQPEEVIYRIDTSKSIVTWIGSGPTGRHNGIIKFESGSVNVMKSDSVVIEQNEIYSSYSIRDAKLTIDLQKIEILDLKYDREQYNRLLHQLKSADYFQVDHFPVAHFELVSIEEIKKDSTEKGKSEFTEIEPTHTINGKLTIKEITKSIEFPARVDFRNLKMEISAKFSINRKEWNINNQDTMGPPANAGNKLINPMVNVGFEIIAYSQEP